jgi:polysaccharide export outer membrane protein
MQRVTALFCVSAMLVAGGCAGAPPAPETTSASRPGPGPGPKTGPAAASAAAPEPAPRWNLAAPPAVSLETPGKGGAEDYRIAAKDQITVTVLGQEDLTRTVRVSESGTITLPLLGELKVAGMTASELEQKITAALKGKFLVNPRTNVTIAEFQGRQVAVMGAVNQPGSYAIRSNYTTVMLALSEAKGLKENADNVAYVMRARPRNGEPQPVPVDLDALLRSGNTQHNVVLESGDSVFVPEANVFYVAGEVEKRGAYPLRRDTTLSKALTEAGGVTKRAALDDIKIVRTLPSGEKKEITGIDMNAVMAGDRNQDVMLRAQDVVVVPASGAKVAAYGVLDFLKGLFSIGITP